MNLLYTPHTKSLSLIAKKARSGQMLVQRELYRFCQRSDFTWRYLANLKPALEYKRVRTFHRPAHTRVLADLKKNGIAITTVGNLFGDTLLFKELESAVWQRETTLAEAIDQARSNVNMGEKHKTYIMHLLGSSSPSLDMTSIFARFALCKEIHNIAIDYFGMWVKLIGYDLWHTFPTHQAPREAQLWHRDPEDRAILKVYVYISDVDHNSGPLSYACGTHAYGNVKGDPPFKIYKEGQNYVRRSNDTQMKKLVSEHQWKTAVGPKATVVFADTRGYHKGGWVTENERILYLCVFTSRAAPDIKFRPHTDREPLNLDPSVRFAIGD